MKCGVQLNGSVKCDHCGEWIMQVVYHLEVGNDVSCYDKNFCCRSHLIEYIAPELKQAVVVKQWIPTPEDEERMSQ